MSAQSRIAIACPNLSLDRTIRVERAALGKVHRSTDSDTRGGGKGVNVARALKCIGREAVVAGFAGGRTGQAVVGLLADEGLSLVAVEGPGETRSCLSVLSDKSPTVFNESGPDIDRATWTRFEHAVLETLDESHVFAFSGSLPPGTPEDAAARLVSAARARGCTTICDTSRAYLETALGAEPDLIKPNLAEALALLGGDGDEAIDAGPEALERAGQASLELLARGPRAVVVSVGAAGVVYATKGDVRTVASPEVEVVNPVGAGDSLVAGLALELAAGATLHEAVLTGTAMGAASCETFPAGLLDPERVRQLRAEISSAPPRTT